MSDIWDKIASNVAAAEISANQSTKLGFVGGEPRPGLHTVKLNAIRSGTGGSAGTTPYVIFSLEVLESDVHPAGTDAMVSVFFDSAVKAVNMKQYVAGILGHEPTQDEVKAAFAPDQPHAGKTLRVETIPRVAKGSGRTFQSYKFSVAKGATAAAAPPAPAVAPPGLPEGWAPHPDAPGYAYKGTEVKLISELA